MKTIAVVNTPESPSLWTLLPALLEFIEGFTSYGYTTSCAMTLEDCANKDILLLSDHKIDFNYLTKLNNLNPDAVYILWCYHNVIDKIPFKKYILTGEYFYKTPRMNGHRNCDKIYKECGRFVPQMLLANEDPSLIGTYKKNIELNGCFMGTPYNPDWATNLPNTMYHDITTSGILPYNIRRINHLRSRIAFGFSSYGNILNYHPCQRIFEGARIWLCCNFKL